MPLYDFRCESCDAEFELIAPAGASEAQCAECGARAVRLFTAPAIGRLPTSTQRKRLEDKRGIDRDGARTRFKEQRRRMREARKRGKRG